MDFQSETLAGRVSSASVDKDCGIVELRRYTMQPGARETLIDLFDREFIETQEAVGMRIIGQFRDLDAPDSFVWLRGFRDLAARKQALTSFYDGAVWAEHRDQANATMADSDNVFLLRPAFAESGFSLEGLARPALTDADPSSGIFAVTIYHLSEPAENGFADWFFGQYQARLTDAGAHSVATLITESSPNTFPRLPVREDEQVLVSMLRLDDPSACHEFRRKLATDCADESTDAAISRFLLREPQVSILSPTSRSLLR